MLHALSVCLLVTQMCPAKTAEPIDWVLTRVGSKNHVSRRGRDPLRERKCLGVIRPTEEHWGSLLRYMQQRDHSILNNGTTCDAAFCQTTL